MTNRSFSYWLICGVIGLLSFSCGNDTSGPISIDLDAGYDDVGDVGIPDENTCGGDDDLTYGGEPAAPGMSCGVCDDGVLICNGEDALECIMASEENACGGCGALPGTAEESCGPCGDGVWSCQGDGTMVCEEATEKNACGGCVDLEASPGMGCEFDEATAGTLQCANLDELRCVGPGQNACGGTAELEMTPGTPCGACNLGVAVCDGANGVTCHDEDEGLNSCGGCAPLAGEPAAMCGVCDGEWVCDDEDFTVCVEDSRNFCGGCVDFGDDIPGLECADGAIWVCESMNELECVEEPVNACGGQEELDGMPAESCGACGDGYKICASPNSLVCVGATETNACGGCGLLPGEDGQACGTGANWECTDEGSMRCMIDEDVNACGGTEVLVANPGVVCGPCNLDVWQCDGEDAVACSGETPCPELMMNTLEATDITATSAILHGEITELPLDPVTEHGFCWGTQSAPGEGNGDCESLGEIDTPETFSLAVDELAQGTTIYVRTYAVYDEMTVHGNQVGFSTEAPQPTGVTATDGVYSDRVVVEWASADGAVEYAVLRDGQEIGRTSATTLDDYDADESSLPTQPANLEASSGTYTEFVRLSWEASQVSDGASADYQVVAVYPNVDSPASAMATGFRGAYPVENYQVSVGGGAFVDVGLILQWDDVDAPQSVITPNMAQATQGEYTAYVALSLTGTVEIDVDSETYVVRAVNARGEGPESDSASGERGIGEVEYQWERSADDSDSGFGPLGGAADTTYNDEDAPADGSGRYYRAELSAAGAQTTHTDGVRGFRGVLPEVAASAPSAVTTTTATLNGEVTSVGVPDATAHGFCWGTASEPSHDDLGDPALDTECDDLGGASDPTTFSLDVTNLESGTHYYVRAYATTVAGTTYSDDASFWTQTPAPVVTTTSAVDHVTVAWSSVIGAVSYEVIRDQGTAAEEVVATLAGTSVNDTGAGAGSLPAAPTLSTTDGFDAVGLSWSEALTSNGTQHTYVVIATNADGLESDPSAPATGNRLAPPVDYYEVYDSDSDSWNNVGAGLSWNYVDAPAGTLSAGGVTATDGEYADRVELASAVATTTDGDLVDFLVRAVNSAGIVGATSNDESGRRIVGAPQYQWQRSSADSDGAYTDMSGATGITHDDFDAPADGQGRYYRVRLSAAGVDDVYSDAERGFRAALPTVTTSEAVEVSYATAQLQGELEQLGAPEPTDHGFCWSTSPGPDLVSGICESLGATSTTGAFSVVATGLTSETTYYFVAYATTNAGTAYGDEEIFTTLEISILFIDDDEGQNAEIAWLAVLDNNNIPYDYEELAVDGHPSSNLDDYDLVIWSTGDRAYQNLTTQNVNGLEIYLDGGGRLLYAGGHAVYQENFAVDFVNNYLGLSNWQSNMPMLQDNSSPAFIDGTGHAIYGTDIYTLQNWTGGEWGNMFSGFEVGVATATGVLQHRSTNLSRSGPSEYLGLLNDTGVFRTLILGFDLNHIHPDQREDLLMDTVDHMLAP